LNQGSVASFQRDIYEKSIPSPSTDAILPVGALTSEEINELLSENTVTNGIWAEYYGHDGTINGYNNYVYTGYWKAVDSFYCYYYPSNNTPIDNCLSIIVSNDSILFHTIDGNLYSQGILINGMALGSQKILQETN